MAFIWKILMNKLFCLFIFIIFWETAKCADDINGTIYYEKSGENEPCFKHEDCCAKLICINGLCRKPVTSKEFLTLAKVCLGITVVTIIIAICSSILKCFLRFNVGRRQNDSSSRNSMFSYRQSTYPRLSLIEIQDEKPPSYEECIHRNEGNALEEPPPYFTTTTNTVLSNVDVSINRSNFIVDNSQNVTELNIQNLSNESSNLTLPKFQTIKSNYQKTAENPS